jgi:hypothetical protein
MQITIVLPFSGAEEETAVWAEEEREIDFAREHERAARCTLAFAAMELQRYLSRTLPEPLITFSSIRPPEDFFIELQVEDPASKNEAFVLGPVNGGLTIRGTGRAGVLYGTYEFLRLQGWRWYAPTANGEIAPDLRETLSLPAKCVEMRPAMELGRGFYLENLSQESAQLLLWMARNRLNVAGHRPSTGALADKLGMSAESGGHIFEEMLYPDRRMPSGKTLWEEHEAWFGLPADGGREKAQAQGTQFCVSQPDLPAFLGEEVVQRLHREWQGADRVQIWGFDTWGSTCACAACRRLGNATDQALVLLSALRDAIDRARREGRLERDVKLAMCCYEGTATLDGPTRPVPSNLLEAGDYGVFFPINRCYAHDFADPACSINRRYREALKSWFAQSPSLPIMVGEYYNVSKFEDLPLLFTTRITHDLHDYHALGARGMTYMHLPMVNWGMRTLTQLLFARCAWDSGTDVPALLEEYYHNWYGPHAGRMRAAYALIEEAWLTVASWRAWGLHSVLTQLLLWQGGVPEVPLQLDDHLRDDAGALRDGRRALALLRRAMRLVRECQREDRVAIAGEAAGAATLAVNPAEARRLERARQYEMRLGEDRRLLRYGIDTLRAMTALVAYHDALLRRDDKGAARAWRDAERAADDLDGYYIPIGYEYPTPGLESRDALTRSQVREVMRRCRQEKARYGARTAESALHTI